MDVFERPVMSVVVDSRCGFTPIFRGHFFGRASWPGLVTIDLLYLIRTSVPLPFSCASSAYRTALRRSAQQVLDAHWLKQARCQKK